MVKTKRHILRLDIFIKVFKKVFNIKGISEDVIGIVLDEVYFAFMPTNFDRIMEVVDVAFPFAYPLHLGSLSPQNGILSQEFIMAVVEGFEPCLNPRL